MGHFTTHPDEQLWKFKIKDLFPHDDELARHVLVVLTANEDLSNVERFKTLLEPEKPRPGSDAITQAKWNSVQLFLVRLRLGFLHNVRKDIIGDDQKPTRLAELASELGDEVRASYEALCNTIRSCPRTKNILRNFRNQASFHYHQRDFERALDIGAEDPGEIIQGNSDVHFIVAYHVLDLIPEGRPSPEEILKIKAEMELIQEQFHAFVTALFPAYMSSRSLWEKVEITHPGRTDS